MQEDEGQCNCMCMQLYTVDELQGLLSFHLEHEDVNSVARKSEFSEYACACSSEYLVNRRVERPILTQQDKKILRFLLLMLISVPYYTSFTTLDWHGFMVPFTNWTLIMTTIGVIMSIYASYDGKRYGRHALCALNSPFVSRAVR